MTTRFRFDGWLLDVQSGELTRGSARLRLQDHPLQVLHALLESPGEVVTRELLIARLWPSVVVDFDSGLNAAVRRLRLALGDDAEHPRYIETLPRRGYRFIATLDTKPAAAPGPAAPQQPSPAARGNANANGTPRKHRRVLVMAVLGGALLVALVAVALWQHARALAPPRGKSIAVLPFTDLSGAARQDDFADGTAEEILDLLAHIPDLRVIGRTSSFAFRGHDADLRRVGAQLGVAYIVEGTIRHVGGRVRVSAELVDAHDGSRLWSDVYDRDFGDILRLQVQIASSIARALQLALGDDAIRAAHQGSSIGAYSLYLRGRAAIDRGDAGAGEAKTDFAQALAIDPGFVKAAEALVLAHLEDVGGKIAPPRVAWPEAVRDAQLALRLDPDSGLTHAVLGLERATYEYDWPGAERELQQVLAPHPRDPDVLYIGAWLAFDLGHQAEAIRLQDTALALDPLNPDSWQNSAYIHFLVGDLDGAERAFQRSSEISPEFSSNHRMLGRILLQRGHAQAALAEMRLEPPSSVDLGLAFAYEALGRRAESDAALERAIEAYRRTGTYGEVNIALVYADRGDRERAFAWLERAIKERDVNLGHELQHDPAFAPLRRDLRYARLLREMKLAAGVNGRS
ncbi:MAG: winged helix-turn-helix domain-containing protein [Gammaproteobacteria bacterium]|nr:winged helix-turn-helix domain-containing protein [Gammaproteobacteria bacterium]